MKKEKLWEYKDAKWQIERFVNELRYTCHLHSLIDKAEEETSEAFGEPTTFDSFWSITGDFEVYSDAIISMCNTLFGLLDAGLVGRRIDIQKRMSKIAYEIFNKMNYKEKRKSSGLRRLAGMYEEENKKKEERKPVKRALVDPSAVSIHPTKQQ